MMAVAIDRNADNANDINGIINDIDWTYGEWRDNVMAVLLAASNQWLANNNEPVINWQPNDAMIMT